MDEKSPVVDVCEERDIDEYGSLYDLPLNGEWLNMALLKQNIPVESETSPLISETQANLSAVFPEIPAPLPLGEVCIFHAPCSDGTAAAFAVAKKYGANCEFYGVNRGSGDTDTRLPDNLAGKHVILVDYVYPIDLMEELIEITESVTVIDHHVSELEVLEFLGFTPDSLKKRLIFSTQFSAALLAWHYYSAPAAEPPPLLYHYINDNDVGSWGLVNVGKFVSGFAAESPVLRPGWSTSCDFAYFEECLDGGVEYIRSRMLIGILAKHIEWRNVLSDAQRCVDRHLKVAPEFVCRTVNASYSSNSGALSRALLEGEHLATNHSEQNDDLKADISLLYYFIDSNRSWKCSLRSSQDSQVNVGHIASLLGGGGHMHAGSFTWYGSSMDEIFCTDDEDSDSQRREDGYWWKNYDTGEWSWYAHSY